MASYFASSIHVALGFFFCHLFTAAKVKSSLQTFRHLLVNLPGWDRSGLARVRVTLLFPFKEISSSLWCAVFLCDLLVIWEKNRARTKSKKLTWDLPFVWSTCSSPWEPYLCTLPVKFVFICHHRAASELLNTLRLIPLAFNYDFLWCFCSCTSLSISVLDFIYICSNFLGAANRTKLKQSNKTFKLNFVFTLFGICFRIMHWGCVANFFVIFYLEILCKISLKKCDFCLLMV